MKAPRKIPYRWLQVWVYARGGCGSALRPKEVGRLLAAVAQHPMCWELGIDEDTAIIISPTELRSDRFTTVTVIDGKQIQKQMFLQQALTNLASDKCDHAYSSRRIQVRYENRTPFL